MSEVLDVDEVRRIVGEQLRSEGIKAIIKHEVEEVAWRTITQSINEIANRFITEASEKFDLRKIREDVVKVLAAEFKLEFRPGEAKEWVKNRVQKLVEAHLATELYAILKEVVEEEVRARRDEIKKYIHENLENLLRGPIGELIRQEIGLIYEELKSLRQQVEIHENRLRALEFRRE